jgi:uncharacterized protein YecT (DUF1311 family)
MGAEMGRVGATFACGVVQADLRHVLRLPRTILILVAVCSLGGCGKSAVECSSPDATAVTTSLLRDSLVNAVFQKTRSATADTDVSRSSIRAAIAQLGLDIADVRTSREDPKSTKRFCEATLKIDFPADVLDKAEQARSAAGMGAVTQLADASDIDREANSFSDKVEYDVQPTDKGDKVFSETNTDTPILSLASDVVAASLMQSAIQQASVAAQQAEQAQQVQQNAALAQQKAANLNEAKTEDQLANQQILAVWRALPSGTRSQLLALQRAWGQKKDADCRVEAASASTDPTEMETARLNCDARVTHDRTDALQQIRSQDYQQQTDSDDGGQD